jgi:hypothetical protein
MWLGPIFKRRGYKPIEVVRRLRDAGKPYEESTVGRWFNGRVEPSGGAIADLMAVNCLTAEELVEARGLEPPSEPTDNGGENDPSTSTQSAA